MSTNFAIFKKALDNFLIHLTIPRSIVNKYNLQVSRTLKTGKALNRASNITSSKTPPPPPFPLQILCLQVSVLIIHWLCFQVSNARSQLTYIWIAGWRNECRGRKIEDNGCTKFETGWQTRCVIGNANVAKSPKKSMRDTKKCWPSVKKCR